MKKAKKRELGVTPELLKIRGIVSFPYLNKTAKNAALYPEDKFKIDINVDEKEFENSDAYAHIQELADDFYQEEDTDVYQACTLKKYNDDDLDPEDKNYKYQVDKVRVRAKTGPLTPPTVYGADKRELRGEEIDIIKNGDTVNIYVLPYAYGDPDNSKKPHGIGLGLQSVQWIKGTAGRAATMKQVATMLDDNEILPDDLEGIDDNETVEKPKKFAPFKAETSSNVKPLKKKVVEEESEDEDEEEQEEEEKPKRGRPSVAKQMANKKNSQIKPTSKKKEEVEEDEDEENDMDTDDIDF